MEALVLLGGRIRDRRKKLLLSQEALAERCGFDRTYISMLERGQRNLAFLNLLKLANGLEIAVGKLLEGF